MKSLVNLNAASLVCRWATWMFLLVGASCSEDAGLDLPNESEPMSWLGEALDPNHTWMTSVSVQLDIVGDRTATVTAQTIGDEQVTILGQKQLKGGSGVMFVDVPQGIGGSFGLVYDDGTPQKRYQRIDLTGIPMQVVDVNFTAAAASTRSAATRAATNTALYGNSIMADSGYLNFGSWGWSDVQKALVETVNSFKNMSTLVDYEIEAGALLPSSEMTANEDILLSFLYGYTGQTGSRTLGYYCHSVDSYADIEFYDISEVLTIDYMNEKAKVQYQLDGNPVWYDANFDYRDDPASPTQSPADSKRMGDDAWNTLNVLNYYGERVTAIRGLTFKLSIPVGKAFGFYLRSNGLLSADQKSILSNKNIPEDKMPKYSANYSNASLNVEGSNKGVEYKTFRSAMAIFDNFTFMGLDDDLNGGDYDCNDVTFALSNSKGERYIPQFTEETLESEMNEGVLEEHPEYKDPEASSTLQSWTLAFENAGKAVDFDFNDVVLKVIPDTGAKKATVSLLATGAQRKTELYYDGTLLGEVHDLFGVDTETMVNTQGEKASVAPISLGEVSWTDESATMETLRYKFTLKVYNEDGSTQDVKGDELIDGSPQMLCVAGDWQWPRERVKAEVAYPLLGDWAKKFDDPEVANWYAFPKSDKVTTPYSSD